MSELSSPSPMTGSLPAAFAETVKAAQESGIDHPIINRMIKTFGVSAESCADILSGR